jgi:hypothetical protein
MGQKTTNKNPDRQHDTSYYTLLTRNMVLTVITVSFAPMILVIGILLFQFNAAYHEKTYAHLEELVHKHKQNIDSFLDEKLSDIRFLAESYGFESLADKVFLKQKLAHMQTEYGDVFVDLGLVDAVGKQLAYAGPFELENVCQSRLVRRRHKTGLFHQRRIHGTERPSSFYHHGTQTNPPIQLHPPGDNRFPGVQHPRGKSSRRQNRLCIHPEQER